MKKYLLQILTLLAIVAGLHMAQAIGPNTLMQSSFAQEEDSEEPQDEEDLAKLLGEEATTLPIVPLNFSVIRKGRVRGTVSIVPVLVIVDPTEAEITELTKLMPLLRSDLMMVSSLLSKKRFRVNRPIDPDFVARHFQNRVDQRIGKGRIKIYIQDAIIRPVR